MKSITKKTFVKYLVIVITVVAIFTPASHIYASESHSTAIVNIPEVINKYANAVNNKDWDSFVESYSPERQKDYVGFPSQYQIENRTGILSVDSIRVYEAKEIPSEHIMEIEPYFLDINNSLYDDIRYFYVGFDYKVYEESEFFYNGVKYELLAIGSVDKTEYIIGHENVYDISKLEKFGYSFNSDAERKAQNVVSQREKGIIVNFDNDIISSNDGGTDIKDKVEGESIQQPTEIEDDAILPEPEINNVPKNENINTQEQIDLEKAKQGRSSQLIQPQSATSPPSTFKLYITRTGVLTNIGFDSYAKCVLPNEWYASWRPKALQAGAVTIKTYAWYNATYPRRPATDYGAHLTDNPANYQHYVANSNQPSTDTAVNAVSGKFMEFKRESIRCPI